MTYLETSFSQLQTVVAIIARYAVMENLYQQSGGALSLKLEYRMVLISLCSSMLEYFARAIEYADTEIHELESLEHGPVGTGTDKTLEQTFFWMQGGRERGMQKCAFLVETIRQKDAASGAFRVVVETTEAVTSDDSDVEVEDVSDEDWERIERDDIEKVPDDPTSISS